MERAVIEECSKGLNDGQWHPAVVESSDANIGSATQYCRAGAREDPWISVGEHPDRVVYGEGYCGAHWDDDAPVQDGMNVWVNSITAADVYTDPATGRSFAHKKFDNQDWYLVRRDSGSIDRGGDRCWHPADDNLRGTDVYGVNDANPIGPETFSVGFSTVQWTQMLLESGVFDNALFPLNWSLVR
jgi:hypothetical protein